MKTWRRPPVGCGWTAHHQRGPGGQRDRTGTQRVGAAGNQLGDRGAMTWVLVRRCRHKLVACLLDLVVHERPAVIALLRWRGDRSLRDQSISDVECQPDLMVKGWCTAPPGHRVHDQPFAGELDRPQLSRSHDTVAVLGQGPVLDTPAQCCVEDSSGIGVEESSFDATVGRATRRWTGQTPELLHQSAEVGMGTGPAHFHLRDGCPGRRGSDPQHRTHPPHERRRVTLPGRGAVIEVAIPAELRLPGLQAANVVIRTGYHQVAVGHDHLNEVEVRCPHAWMLVRRAPRGGRIDPGEGEADTRLAAGMRSPA